MARKIALIEGHPDTADTHFVNALAERYAKGAAEAGHLVHRIRLGALDFPILRSKRDWDEGELPASLREAQRQIGEAEHLVILYPLWMGGMPALLKAFFEQILRPGFAISREAPEKMYKPLLKEHSARIVVTMGMPAFFYRWFFRAHSLKALERNMLSLCGIGPIRATLVGNVEAQNPKGRERWLHRLEEMGRRGL